MGHATRFVALLLLAAGIGALGTYTADRVRVGTLTAEFPAEPASSEDPPTAEFAVRAADPLRIQLLGISPHAGSTLHDRLEVSIDSTKNVHDLTLGSEFPVGEETFRVADVRTWQGLLPVPGGAAMASVSILQQDAAPLENVLLRAGQRLDIKSELSIELRACDGRADALAQIAALDRESARGRWGIADATGVIWFESFTPGAGARLLDGSLVTLESFSPDGPVLIVRKRTADGDELLRLDGPSNEPPLLLEFGGGDLNRVTLFVADDGNVVLSSPRADTGPVDLAVGQSWEVAGAGYRLRLEQALLSAAPVQAADSPFFEAVLESPGSRVRVRQGEAVRVGDALLRYLREPGNRTAVFQLRVFVPGTEVEDVALAPGSAHEFAWAGGVWRISHANVEPGTGITIERVGSRNTLLFAGLACLATSLGLLRLTRRHTRN